MDKWEYIVISSTIEKALLNKLGGQGWELVAIYDGFAFFKRKKATLARSKKA